MSKHEIDNIKTLACGVLYFTWFLVLYLGICYIY